MHLQTQNRWKYFHQDKRNGSNPKMKLILVLLPDTQKSDTAQRALTLSEHLEMSSRGSREWAALVADLRPEGRNVSGQGWLQETSESFICQWVHDRECCIPFWFSFFQECQFFLPQLPLLFLSLFTHKKQLGNLSFHFFTGATYKFRKSIIQVFSAPVSSYSSTDLQHTVPLNHLGSDLTPIVHHGNSIAKEVGTPFASLKEKPSQGPMPKEWNVPPCNRVPHPQSSRMH